MYHLSAQFPGPTAPRDFVEVLLTSSAALSKPNPDETVLTSDKDANAASIGGVPHHFMVISKPCKHPECPPRDGFVRGEYESIEFIREIPNEPVRSSSTTDLTRMGHQNGTSGSMNKEAVLRNAHQRPETLGMSFSSSSDAQLSSSSTPNGGLLPKSAEHSEGRARGRTISFAESRGNTAKGEAFDKRADESDNNTTEMNPVEWIMITRSDPGGSVPRFMVERGTPSSIVADASKFLNWACQKQHPDDDEERHDQDVTQDTKTEGTAIDVNLTSGQVSYKDGSADTRDATSQSSQESDIIEGSSQVNSIISNMTSAAASRISSYTPQSILDHLAAPQQTTTSTPSLHIPQPLEVTKDQESDSISMLSSASFASADSHFSTITSTKSTPDSPTPSSSKSKQSQSPHEKEIAKLAVRKARLDDKLRQTREKETKDKEALTSKEEARVKKAEGKHAREVKRAEERFEKEMKAIEDKERKEEEKRRKAKEAEEEKQRRKLQADADAERKRKEKEEKESVEKGKQEMKRQIEELRKEKDLLGVTVTSLQRENTALVAAIGKLDGGQAVLDAVKNELT